MSNNSSTNLNNEQTLLINILNTMYNDNIRQIYNYTDSLNSLNDTNIQIRNLIYQILNPPISNNNNIRRNNRQNRYTSSLLNNINRYRNSNPENSENSLGRIVLNNIPYVIDSIEEYRFPLRRDSETSQILQNFFQPVEVFPTQTQIDTATRIVRYSDIISPRNRSCPISLDNFNDTDLVTIIRFCGHIFNTDEINTWFRSNCRCPVCRYDIRTYNSNSTTELFRQVSQNENNLNPTSNVNEITENQEQNNISNSNSERNFVTNNTNQSAPLRNRFLNSSTLQENDIINIFMDLSGNLLNNITNSDSLLRLFNAVNNNYSN
jgi:hypothetical protein